MYNVCVHTDVDVCVCFWDFTWGTFSCPGPNLRGRFFLRGLFFGSSEKSGCTAVFSVLGMHVSLSFRQVLGSEHCSCSVCMFSTAYATTHTLDDWCVVRPHLGDIFVPGPDVRGPVWGRGTPYFPPLSIYFLIFSSFYFSLSFIGFIYFLLLSILPLSTRIVPLRFQAGGRRKRPHLGLVCCVWFVLSVFFS